MYIVILFDKMFKLKVHYVVLGKTFLCLNILNKQTDLKGQHSNFILFYFICGGPCHLSSFKEGPYSPLRTPGLLS